MWLPNAAWRPCGVWGAGLSGEPHSERRSAAGGGEGAPSAVECFLHWCAPDGGPSGGGWEGCAAVGRAARRLPWSGAHSPAGVTGRPWASRRSAPTHVRPCPKSALLTANSVAAAVGASRPAMPWQEAARTPPCRRRVGFSSEAEREKRCVGMAVSPSNPSPSPPKPYFEDAAAASASSSASARAAKEKGTNLVESMCRIE